MCLSVHVRACVCVCVCVRVHVCVCVCAFVRCMRVVDACAQLEGRRFHRALHQLTLNKGAMLDAASESQVCVCV
jgi:hypothetical protein